MIHCSPLLGLTCKLKVELVLVVLDESKLENIVHIAGVEVELTSGVIPTLATPNYYR